MLISIIFLSITIAIRTQSIHSKSSGFSVSLSNSTRQQNFSKLFQIYGDPVPSNFIFIGRFDLQQPASFFTYSPDDKWIVYHSYPHQSNYLYFRYRTSLTNYTKVKIGQTSTIVYTFGFSRQSDFLFVGTQENNIFYACKFSPNMSEDDCKSSLDLGQKTGIDYIHTNSAQKIVINSDKRVWILNYTKEGELSLETKLDFGNTIGLITRWHPQAEKDMLIIVRRNNKTNGYISLYNITSGAFYNLSTDTVWDFQVVNNGETILGCTSSYLVQYSLTLTSVTKVGILINQGCTGAYVSLDGSLFFAMYQQNTSNYLVQVHTPVLNSQAYKGKHNPPSPQSSSKDKISKLDTQNLTLKLVTTMLPNLTSYGYMVSSDGNQILIIQNNTYFDRYLLCYKNSTFYSNLQCLKCSPNCSTCHFNQSFCFSCINSSYVLTDNKCLHCNESLTGCLSCSNATYCQYCDTMAGFTRAPVNGLCQCAYFYYAEGNTCVLCDTQKICTQCTSPTHCISCNKDNNWQQTPINGTCVCETSFYNNLNGTCILCDPLKVCVSCVNSSTCTKCDSSKNFIETPVNGNCVCETSFYNNLNGTCILCDPLKVCVSCVNQQTCTKCDSSKNFSETPINGNCVCADTFVLNSGKCILCNIEFCTNCLVQNECVECDSSTTLSDGKCVKGSSNMIILLVVIGVGVILVGIVVLYCICKRIQKRKSKESLLSQVEEDSVKKVKTIKQLIEDKNVKSTEAKKQKDVSKEKMEFEFQLPNKQNKQIHQKIVQQEQQNDQEQPQFLIQYRKLIQKSVVVEDKSNKKSRVEKQKVKQQERVQPKFKQQKSIQRVRLKDLLEAEQNDGLSDIEKSMLRNIRARFGDK